MSAFLPTTCKFGTSLGSFDLRTTIFGYIEIQLFWVGRLFRFWTS